MGRLSIVSIVLKVSTVSIIAAVGGTRPNLSPPLCRPCPPWLWPCPALATHSDLPFPARALPFYPVGLPGSVAALRRPLGRNSLNLFVFERRSFPLPLEFGWPPCFPFKIPLVSVKWSRFPLPFPFCFFPPAVKQIPLFPFVNSLNFAF